jgi:hypothetical protein
MTVTETIEQTTTATEVPTDKLNKVFTELTHQPATGIIWDVLELPYKVRVSKSDPSYTSFHHAIAVLEKERLNHSKRCACPRCDLPVPRWKYVERKLTIYVPFVNVINDDERFTAHLGLSGLTYSQFSEPLPDTRGYRLRREYMGALLSSKLPSADPLFMRLFTLACDQRKAAAFKERVRKHDSGVRPNPLTRLEASEEALPEPVSDAERFGRYFRDLSVNYDDYYRGVKLWPARPEGLVLVEPTAEVRA